MWEISKRFDFCYGHRVWSQVLNEKYALSNKPKCRHKHGHEGTIWVHVTGSVQNDGMVIDFNHLNWLKSFIDDVIDHKFIVDINDPYFDQITGVDLEEVGEDALYNIYAPNTATRIAKRFHEPMNELEEGYVIVDFVPTSENLAKWIYDIVVAVIKEFEHARVDMVEWKETPKTSAIYRPGSI